ncbi:polyketide synthase Pks13 [Dietzia massiliensis]|uniref:polyketide synthase Pks13 n=1 Tax=Dietzia massiliensis TaxID=2697499 RepID=UPI001BCF81B2|nr:polyketide synthase Pks13 [Dietzia massiliensis]MBS7548520.1 type I polyketide synthase [Dietzia massiliensis]
MAQSEMTVVELREWMRGWVCRATGLDISKVTDDRSLEEYGLSSRDAVSLSADLEDLIGRPLDATVAYQHPTIASLAEYVVNGPVEADEPTDLHTFRERGAGMEFDVAVIGLATRFPGGADSPEATWDLLASGRDATSPRPDSRWSEWAGDAYVQQVLAEAPDRGGWLDDTEVKDFDAEFFGMSPREAEMVDPQQRLALELTWEALENAHIPASDLKGREVGVFMGSSSSDYQVLLTSDSAAASPYAVTGASNSIISNRISYTFDFRGPSMTLDTACSTSLVAVHEAVNSLRLHESDLVVAGGVNMMLAPAATMGFAKTGAALSPDGRIKAFSSDANGICRSEGGGVFILKRLSEAERDGDEILAVIKGSAVNSDGRSNGMTAPNPDAQVSVLRQAYADAGVDPREVDYIEAHGTGTILGDPIEATAIGQVLGRGRDADRPTLLGSAKTNFGHMESAAGAAGLAKIILGMQHDAVPPTINYAGPNPYIDFDAARLSVVTETTPWPRYSGRAVAGISGFGFGGTNAHVVVAEYRPQPAHVVVDAPSDTSTDAPADTDPTTATTDAATTTATATDDDVARCVADAVARNADELATTGTAVPGPPATVLVVSASLPSRRKATAAQVADWLEAQDDSIDLGAVARTLSTRNHGRSRGAVVGHTRAELVAGLRALAAGDPGPGVFSADAPAGTGDVWVFSGFGSQHRKMAKELYLSNPLFASCLDAVDELIDFEAGYRIAELILDDSQTYELENSQVGIFAIQVALVDTLRALGAKPEAVIGHSMGEVAAAYATGGLNLEDAVRVITVRSRLMGDAEGQVSEEEAGAMALVEYSAEEIAQIIADNPQFASIEPAVYAAPTHTTVGGRAKPVADFVAWVEEQGKFARQLQVRGAGHTSDVDMLLGELAAEIAGLEPRELTSGLFSSVDRETFYRAGHEPVHAEEYWVKGMRHSVWFTHAVRKAVDAGYVTFLELAPNPVAAMSVAATCFDAGLMEPNLLHALKRKESEADTLLHAIAQLYVHGHTIDMPSVVEMIHGYVTGPDRYAPVPGTAWKRRTLWPKVTAGGGSGDGRMPGSYVALPDGRHAWQVRAEVVPSVDALMSAAAAAVIEGATLTAVDRPGILPPSGSVTTTLTPHPGGASLQVHARSDEESAPFVLVASGAVSGGAPIDPSTAPEMPHFESDESDAPVVGEDDDDEADTRWNPESGESISDRLARIIGSSMGYSPDDLPRELALLDLGLDSLMAVRIKNRVEHEFSIPPLELQAMRDASLNDVAEMVRFAVENPEEVGELAAQQARGEGAVDVAALRDGDSGDGSGAADSDGAAGSDGAAPAGDAVSVAPRDDTERMAFGAWAVVTGAAAPGVTGALPSIDEATRETLARRLSERSGGDITADQLAGASTIAEVADLLRPFTEVAVEGNIRVLAQGEEGRTPLFLFHAAGGSSFVYEPLVERLGEGTPVYGVERVEGPLEARAATYLDRVRELAAGRPVALGGWSFGGALAVEVARQLRAAGDEVSLVVLLDTVQPSEPIPDTLDEAEARWKRYSEFAKRTYGLDVEVPRDFLAEHGEDGVLDMLMGVLGAEANAMGGGVIEHQRASFVDNRILQSADMSSWAGVGAEVPFVLYRAERMHDGAIELEPRYERIDPDGGWAAVVTDLEVVHLEGDHLAMVDEPVVGTVGKHLARRLTELDAGVRKGTNA